MGWSAGAASLTEYLEPWMFHRSLASREERRFQDMVSVADAVKVKYNKELKVPISF